METDRRYQRRQHGENGHRVTLLGAPDQVAASAARQRQQIVREREAEARWLHTATAHEYTGDSDDESTDESTDEDDDKEEDGDGAGEAVQLDNTADDPVMSRIVGKAVHPTGMTTDTSHNSRGGGDGGGGGCMVSSPSPKKKRFDFEATIASVEASVALVSNHTNLSRAAMLHEMGAHSQAYCGVMACKPANC